MTDQLPELDPVIHAQARLRVVAALSTLADGDKLSFPRLQEILAMTAGNLSVHLRKLEDAGYVAMDKRFVDRKPQTSYALTERGRTALLDYVAHLERLLPPKSSERKVR